MVFAFSRSVRHSALMPVTRRERLRVATVEEIKAAALDQIASAGAQGLSMRGIARTIGMSPAGLYRYCTGLDELITELITDAYNDLADAVFSATTALCSPRDQLRAGMLAYRRWGLDNRNRFLLIFGTPIPGYAAPEGGPTTAANRRIGEAFFAIGAAAWREGGFEAAAVNHGLEPAEERFAAEVAPGFPAAAVRAFLSAWAHFHGIVTLEILHQLDWIYANPDAFYRGEVEAIADRLFGAVAD